MLFNPEENILQCVRHNVMRRPYVCVSFCLLLCHGLCGAGVGQPVLTVVPPPEREVYPPDESHSLVDGHHLLMVSPQEDHGGHVVGMSHDLLGCQTV